MLEISRGTLYRKIVEYGLEADAAGLEETSEVADARAAIDRRPGCSELEHCSETRHCECRRVQRADSRFLGHTVSQQTCSRTPEYRRGSRFAHRARVLDPPAWPDVRLRSGAPLTIAVAGRHGVDRRRRRAGADATSSIAALRRRARAQRVGRRASSSRRADVPPVDALVIAALGGTAGPASSRLGGAGRRACPDTALGELAAAPGVDRDQPRPARSRHARAHRRGDRRARWVTRASRRRRRRRRRRDHRLRRHRTGTTISTATASCTSSTSSTSSRSRTTTTVTARTSPASSPAAATTRTARAAASPRARTWSCCKALDDARQRATSATSSRRSTTRSSSGRVYNIRVINLSVAAGVYESYNTDPLTLAAKRAVDAGIVVVAAAGNLGRNDRGQPQFGGITSPGQCAVGADRRRREPQRHGRSRATTRSPPSARAARAGSISRPKPDLVAPGVGIESLADAGSTLFVTQAGGAALGHGRHGDAAVSEPERHEHGGAGRRRRRSR